MIKYRVWDKQEQKFIYPVIDITNDFYQTYPKERFVFDKFIQEVNGIDYYENDIIEIPFTNSKNWRRKRNYLSIVCDDNITHSWRGDWYVMNKREEWYDGWIDSTYCSIPKIDKVIQKIGNIHQNFDILKDWYLKQIKNKKS